MSERTQGKPRAGGGSALSIPLLIVCYAALCTAARSYVLFVIKRSISFFDAVATYIGIGIIARMNRR